MCILVSSDKGSVTPEIIQDLVLDLESGVAGARHLPRLEQVVCGAQITQSYMNHNYFSRYLFIDAVLYTERSHLVAVFEDTM